MSAGSTIEQRRQDSHCLYGAVISPSLAAALHGSELSVSRPGHFTLVEGKLLSIKKQGSWAPEHIWTHRRRHKSLVPAGIQKTIPPISTPQLRQYIECSISAYVANLHKTQSHMEKLHKKELKVAYTMYKTRMCLCLIHITILSTTCLFHKFLSYRQQREICKKKKKKKNRMDAMFLYYILQKCQFIKLCFSQLTLYFSVVG